VKQRELYLLYLFRDTGTQLELPECDWVPLRSDELTDDRERVCYRGPGSTPEIEKI